jgi:hypothetical protein
LFGLNRKADATSSVAAIFSAATSLTLGVSGSAGPLTVARLFRSVLRNLPGRADRVGFEDFAMVPAVEDQRA